MSERAPERLRQAIAADLAPVRPLPSPWRRGLLVAPLALVLLAGVPRVLGYRPDLARLGFGLSWGLSFTQLAAGVLLVACALRETVPGQGRPWLVLSAWLVGAEALFFGVTLVTFLASPRFVAGPRLVYFGVYCFSAALLAGLPVLLLAAWLARRALVTRPLLTGALYGMGSGLIGDSGHRVFCSLSDPKHVLLAHGAAVLALVVLGAASAHSEPVRDARR